MSRAEERLFILCIKEFAIHKDKEIHKKELSGLYAIIIDRKVIDQCYIITRHIKDVHKCVSKVTNSI